MDGKCKVPGCTDDTEYGWPFCTMCVRADCLRYIHLVTGRPLDSQADLTPIEKNLAGEYIQHMLGNWEEMVKQAEQDDLLYGKDRDKNKLNDTDSLDNIVIEYE